GSSEDQRRGTDAPSFFEVNHDHRENSRGDPFRGDEPLRHLQGDWHRPRDAVQVLEGTDEHVVCDRGPDLGCPRTGDRNPAEAQHEEGGMRMAEQLVQRGRVWYYRFTDADGKRRMRRGCTDRRVTEQMAAAAVLEADKIRNGLVDPKESAYRDHEARPLAD